MMSSFWFLPAALLLALATQDPAPQSPGPADFINRRDQARSAFLASPGGIYGHYCAHCHGDDARGNGRLWVSEMPANPPDLTALGEDREYLVTAIRDGSASHDKSNLCPAWGQTISSENVERLAQYIESLGDEADGALSSTETTESFAAEPIAEEPFPWLLSLLVLAQIAIFFRLFARRTIHAPI